MLYSLNMDFDFSKTDIPSGTISIALRTVYMIHADASYDVRKREHENRDFIAVRTYDGIGQIHIEGFEEMTVLAGTLLFFEHRLVRRYLCKGNKWDFWWFEFSTEEVIFPLNTILQIDIIENEMQYCNSCLEFLRKDSIYTNSVASAILNLIMHKWIMNLNIKSTANKYQSSIEKVIGYMTIKLPQIMSLKEMADMTELSERRFRDLFIKTTGHQPKKYYDTLRIKIAEQLLRNSNYSIDEISNRLGYSSQFHFSKAFKKAHGVAPVKYRQT